MPIRTKRMRAFHAQCGFCCYCDRPMLADPSALQAFMAAYGLTRKVALQLAATAEHLHARCEGGGDGAGNIAAAHRVCNARRHQRANAPPPERYRDLVQRRCRTGGRHAPAVPHMPPTRPPR